MLRIFVTLDSIDVISRPNKVGLAIHTVYTSCGSNYTDPAATRAKARAESTSGVIGH